MDQVLIENDWYDGPRKGVAIFNGKPHRFISNFKDYENEKDTFNIFPISSQELKLEIEQWKIFVEWNKRYESGEVTTESHPGHGNLNQRWDEIEKILNRKRDKIPENAKLVYASFKSNDQEARYSEAGLSYGVIWKLINDT